MSYSRIELGIDADVTEPKDVGPCPVRQRRRRRSLPRVLTARTGAATPRTKATFMKPTARVIDPRVLGVHDFGDGRHAIEFEGPSLDMMLYHDRGVTLAEWVTVDGELVSMILVGDC
jgi:hypothetical protein